MIPAIVSGIQLDRGELYFILSILHTFIYYGFRFFLFEIRVAKLLLHAIVFFIYYAQKQRYFNCSCNNKACISVSLLTP